MHHNGAYADKLSQMPYTMLETVRAQSLTTFGQDYIALQSQVDNVWEFVSVVQPSSG